MEVIIMKLSNKHVNAVLGEGALQKSDKDMACDLNYEAEYHRLREEFAKLKADRDYLAEELKVADREARWHHGFRSAVELIFGKSAYNHD
jgi:hypothetical protein